MATSERSQLLPRKSKLKRHRNSDSSKTPPVDKDSVERPAKRQRLLIVANRLPLSAERNGQDPWSLKATVGGLANALFDVELEGYEATWIGWPGVSVEDEAGKQALTTALAEKKCIPVFLTKEIVRDYYNGFCNKILWPLFHYFGLPREGHTTRSFQLQFEAYSEANKLFADVVNQHYEEGDLVWCHDYHLMFVPQKLKENNPQMKVGWFLHTPFPSYEIHQNLPSRSELLCAVLAADLVGFHTYDYARHFINACTRILGLKGIPDGVVDQERLTRVAAFPIGINSQRFISALKNPEAQDNIKKLQELLSGKKVIFGVDHLDMTKGIPQKYLAFEKFLEENEDWREKVVLVQIAIPPRTDVATYEKLASQVHEMVGRINGRFGTCTATPICHLDRSLDFDALCEHYSISDVALVTSLRDGMNLVSYEFVACQDSMNGVLILSEFAGAAQSLGAGAILVNPWNLTEVAAAIGRALTMPVEERETRHRQNFEHVTKHTAQKWAEFFLSELKIAVIKAQQRIRMVPPRQLVVRDAVRRYVECEHGLLILGFNAALTEARGKNQKEKSELPEEGLSPKLDTKLKLHPDLKEPLNMLCQDPNTTIVVLSGSDKNLLEETFGEYAMWVVAENGMFVRSPEGIQTPTERQGMASVTNIKRVLEYFTKRTPRSYIVERETSLLWNYKDADVEIGRLQARDMLQQLCTGVIVNGYVAVVQGSHSIEVRPLGVTKGVALVHTLKMMIDSQAIPSYEAIDYVLCLGHFTEEDEDIYDIFNPDREPDEDSSSSSSSVPPTTNLLTLTNENYFPCAVDRALTSARYGLNSSDDVVALLKEMAEAKASQSSG